MAEQATAEIQPDGKYKVTHADGTVEELTEAQFQKQYNVDPDKPAEPVEDGSDMGKGDNDSGAPSNTGTLTDAAISTDDGRRIGTQAGDEDPDTASKRNRPETTETDAEGFWGQDQPEDFGDEYSQAVETELKEVEEHIKTVRAELKSINKAKPEDRDFGALRSAMHDLSHGKSLLRSAHVATVRHDGPERLRPAPTPETNANSGPGEELNPDQHAHRVVGR